MATLPIEQAGAQPQPAGGASLTDAVVRIWGRMETETVAALAAAPTLVTDMAAALPPLGRLGAEILQALAVAGSVLLAYWLVRRSTRAPRLASGGVRNAFLGLARLVGFEILALAVAAIVARVLLVRVFGHAPAAAIFPVEVGTAVVRWLSGVTVALIVFQPAIPRLRLAPLNDASARTATIAASAILAAGHAQNVLIQAGLRGGLPLASAKLLSIVAALCLCSAALATLHKLRRQGLKAPIVAMAMSFVGAITALWIASWLSRDFGVYRGAVVIATIVLIALALDRTIILTIRESRRPDAMRRLFMLRVVVDGVAALIVLRVILDFWAAGFAQAMNPGEWRSLSLRITAASIIVYIGAIACAAVHVWIESILHPGSRATSESSIDNQLTRLSTVLPLVRFAAIALIATIFTLAALSTVGVDVTPLLAGAGVIGLAVSLGSQTLVKDIVAGLFYMMDDVFRLGETIEAGAYSGVIEQIKLRSIRLRGRDGRLHTIPLGDLGAVTNLSRRLSTVTIRVGLGKSPDRRAIEWFRIRVWSAFQSEPAIRSAIIGEMTAAGEANKSDGGGTISYTVTMTDAAARQQRGAMRFLVEEVIDEMQPAGVERPVDIVIEEPAPAAGSAMNMA